jgi:hypothetical protein
MTIWWIKIEDENVLHVEIEKKWSLLVGWCGQIIGKRISDVDSLPVEIDKYEVRYDHMTVVGVYQGIADRILQSRNHMTNFHIQLYRISYTLQVHMHVNTPLNHITQRLRLCLNNSCSRICKGFLKPSTTWSWDEINWISKTLRTTRS